MTDRNDTNIVDKTDKVQAFLKGLAGKRIAVCGIGHNNTPVVLQLLGLGARVTACDKRTREQLGDAADRLEQAKEQAERKPEHRTLDREKVKTRDRSVQR